MRTVQLDLPDAEKVKKLDSFNDLWFAFAKRVGSGKYEQVSTWASCRDNICGQAKRAISNKLYPNQYTNCSGEIDFQSVCLLAYNKKTASTGMGVKLLDERMDRYMKGALNLLHFFEKMGRLKRSKVYSTKHSLHTSNRIYLFEGSGEWMRSTHLISLYTLLIRCGGYQEFEKGIKNFEGFLKTVKSLYSDWEAKGKDLTYRRYRKWPFSGYYSNIAFLVNIAPKLKVLMEQRKHIFSGKRKTDHYCSTAHSSDGIAQFVYGTVDDKEVQRKFMESCDKYEIREIAK